LPEKSSKDFSVSSISCGIVCYDVPTKQLEDLFESLSISIERLLAIHPDILVKIYVIDNSIKCTYRSVFEALTKMQETETIKICYIGGHGNIGYGAAQNLAISVLNSDLHLILNSDVIVSGDSLVEGVKAFCSCPSLAMLSPHAENCLGEKQFLCKRFPTVMTLLIRGFIPSVFKVLFKKRLDHYEMRDLPETTLTEGVPLISGCFMLSETRVLQSIGGFDESYFLYFEDFDLSIRMGSLGILAYSPNVRITHAGGYAAKKGIFHIGYFLRSGIRFFNTHGWRFW